MGVASWHIRTLPHHIPPTFFWANLSLFTLEIGGHAAYMETHPYYTNYHSWCVLLFGVAQCNIVLLKSSNFTNKISIGCLEIIKQK